MMAHLEHQDTSSTVLETCAIEEVKGEMHSHLEGNGVMFLTNGKDIGQETLFLWGKSHEDTNAVEELSQSLEGITIEKSNKLVVDIDQVNECSDDGCAKHLTSKLAVAGPNNGSPSMEGENGNMLENKEEVDSTKPSKITTLEVLKGQEPAPPTMSVKSMAQAATQREHVHAERENGRPLTRVLNSKNINNLSPKRSSTTKALSSKFTIARPFALATDRRAEERPAATVPNCPLDFPQDVKTLRQKFFVVKSSHSENIKRSVSQDLKVQTNATGFTFRLDERAKKRKEFYSKLQEKFNAKEEEKTQMQARTEKEDEEAIKVLRRSLTFKASPMPSFYQEGPPPKVESKKIPTTQAKSPKFSSRSRYVGSKSVSNGVHELEHSRSNLLQQHLESNIVDMLHQSNDCMTKRLIKCSLLDSPSEQISNSNLLPLSNNEGAHATVEMNERNCEQTCESEVMISKQKPNEGNKARQVAKGAHTKASSERHERFQGKCGSNVLRNCANKSLSMPSSMPNKMKPKVQPLPFDNKEDLSPKTNKTTKKERLKALTPYFRKRESIGNVRQSTARLVEEVGINLEADIVVGT